MSERPDKDELERGPAQPEPPRVSTAASATLPLADPGEQPLTEQRKALVGQIEELEGTLRYMGSAHPKRRSLQARLEQLRMMLLHLDGAIQRQP